MFEYSTPEAASTPARLAPKRLGAVAAAVLVGGSLGGYAIHEHNAAQKLQAKNDQTTAALSETKHELLDLTTRVNTLLARAQAPAPAEMPTPAEASRAARSTRAAAAHVRREDPRYKKLQSQLDAQNKAIEETRSAIESTRGDLVNTRTELSGSIAHTHDELVLLQKKGERNYAEFDISKSKEFQHKGPFGVRLKKANVKHQYADLELLVDDRDLSQKHVNLYQPVMFYTPDSQQPVEVVINEISKNHIHGYISAPKYGRSELAAMASPSGDTTPQQGDRPVRQRLPVPQP